MENEKQIEQSLTAKKPREKSIVISFRLSESEFEPYKIPLEKSGLNRSQFFRDLWFQNKSRVIISEKKTSTKDYTRYLHFVSKISNNLNQLARSLNRAERRGVFNQTLYMAGLNNLNSIRLLLASKLGEKG